MGATRFFVSGVFAPGDEAALEGPDARKLLTVLRKRDGDALEIVDSSGRLFAARLHVLADGARAVLDRELAAPKAPSLQITLAQGLPKGSKMDYIVEKATELGVERIVAFTSERTAGDGARDGKRERWARVAESAAKQCGRTTRLAVDGPIGFEELVAEAAAYDLVLVPWELAPAGALRDVLPALLGRARRVLVTIGPEGGLAAGETEALTRAGAHVLSLGSRILRTETAGLVAATALLYASGDL